MLRLSKQKNSQTKSSRDARYLDCNLTKWIKRDEQITGMANSIFLGLVATLERISSG